MGRRRAPELYRAPFPLYALQVDPSTGLLIAAGGGGAAKTGIKNGVLRTLPPPSENPRQAGHPTRISAENLSTGLSRDSKVKPRFRCTPGAAPGGPIVLSWLSREPRDCLCSAAATHFLQLEQINGRLSASLLHSHDTETRATMNLALAGNILAAGQDAHCQLLRFQTHQQKGKSKAEKAGTKEQGPRQRKGAAPPEKKSGADTHQEGVELSVENLQAVQTDFSPDPLQKVVCCNHDSTLLATGGTDGYVRVWKVRFRGLGRMCVPCSKAGIVRKRTWVLGSSERSLRQGPLEEKRVPSLEKVLEFKAHAGEIEDLALGPDGKLVTVGWDLKAFVWQKDQLVTQLHWQENGPTFSNTPYRYQACRCEDPGGGLDLGVEGEWEEIWGKLVAVASITSGLSRAQEGTELLRRAGQAPGAEQLLTGPQVPDQPGGLRLFTVQIPHKRLRQPPPCYLTAWDGSTFLPLRTKPCGHEVISCLTVRSEPVLARRGVRRLYYVREAHGIVVTDVAFLPEKGRGPELLGSHETALFSVAVDSRCQLHLLPSRRSVPVWVLLLLCVGLIVMTILLLQSAFPGFL
ncbi:hypothetical protein QTO34_006751 [Cnephaeus nilssonii]|uniref:Prolactin regulatory element-binding protein n=1 Tax=Cnephaeus nilssonii TaxID=3371016 RepID=A0AA40HL41_CNENI|nr:hypothetical protein QTO34_006751 [Eptesicus nilssonii]